MVTIFKVAHFRPIHFRPIHKRKAIISPAAISLKNIGDHQNGMPGETDTHASKTT